MDAITFVFLFLVFFPVGWFLIIALAVLLDALVRKRELDRVAQEEEQPDRSQ